MVARVELDVHPNVMELTGKPRPKDGLEGKFSVYYAAAVGIVAGKAGEAECSAPQRAVGLRKGKRERRRGKNGASALVTNRLRTRR